MITERERFTKALRREKIEGHVPHFELVFYLTLEAINKIHHQHRGYWQWDQMSRTEQKLQMKDIAESYTLMAEKYNHDSIFVGHFGPFERTAELLETVRELSDDRYFIMMHGDPTLSIPNGDEMVQLSTDLYENPDKIKEQCKRNVEHSKEWADKLSQRKGLVHGFGMCSDYCFNINPFFTPDMFAEFVTPYLAEIIKYYRDLGFYSIKHTDGNIMPILQQMLDCKPDALHSLDPQGGVDLKELKRTIGDQVCLIGNVNCGLMQTGTIEELKADVRRALRDGMPGYGYIFSTSNCVYTGLDLERYEIMHKIWREEGIYQ